MAGDDVVGAGSLGADTGMNTDFGVASPGSPADEMGLPVMPPSGDVGAADPGSGQALEGDDQENDRGIVSEATPPASEALQPRLTDDIEPNRSNISGPTPLEEGRG